jgi:hypothetical protein
MPQLQHHPPPGERYLRLPDPPVERAIVRAVVTELAAVLEPVGRDPFLDASDDVPYLRPSAPARGRLAGLRCG